MRSLIIDGMDTFADWGLVLSSKELNPPAPKFYTVDIPGGNGNINLTQALSGDTAYENRKQEFVFTMYQGGSFEALKTAISNYLHGQEFDYKLSWDPDYTYHGWFAVDKYGTDGILNQLTLTVDADPYKFKKRITQVYNTSKGIILYPVSGRKRVQPRFEFTDDSVVVFDGARYEVPKGTYTLDDVWFEQGRNEVYLAPQSLTSNVFNSEMKKYTHGEIAAMKRIFQWYAGVERHSVKTVKLTPKAGEVGGTITITATDSEGSSFTSSVNLGDLKLRLYNGVSDTLEIEHGTARLVRRIVSDNGTLSVLDDPTVFTFEFSPLYSNDGEIVSVTTNANCYVEYSTDSVNVTKTYTYTTFGYYAAGGANPMKHGEMATYSISQLGKIDSDTSEPSEVREQLAYLDYEWSDL